MVTRVLSRNSRIRNLIIRGWRGTFSAYINVGNAATGVLHQIGTAILLNGN